MSKVMVERLKQEKSHLTAIKKRMIADGVELTGSGLEEFPGYPKSEKEPGKSVKIECLEVNADVPEATGEFRGYDSTEDNLLEVNRKLRKIRIGQEKINFSVRTVEYAMYSQERFESFPHWIKNVNWEQDYVEPGKRVKWNRLKLVQPGVAQRSVALRYRIKEKSEIVAKDVIVKEPATA
jgi:hypothetical protein